MQRGRQGGAVVTAQDAQRARQAHRRALRRKLADLLDEADRAYRAGDYTLFEDVKASIRLVLADLANTSGGRADRQLAKLPATPSRRGIP